MKGRNRIWKKRENHIEKLKINKNIEQFNQLLQNKSNLREFGGIYMKKQLENDIERKPIKNFRELVKRYEKFGDKVAFKFKQARRSKRGNI